MQFPFYSLKTGVLTHLAFLIVAAMLLINVVMVKFSERDLIQARLSAGRMLLHTLEQKVGYETTNRKRELGLLEKDSQFMREITQLLRVGGFSEVLMVSRDGIKILDTGHWGKTEKEALLSSRDALATKNFSYHFSGSTWGVIWLAHERLTLSAPMLFEGHLLGATTISAHLPPLYQMLRKTEKIVLFYILLNTIILVLCGIYLLSRTVIKPIHKLLRITEEFKEGETFPHPVESSRNEIGQLFRSLNMMLKRLEENKKELRAHISSLEEANQEIKKAQEEIIKSEKLASVGRLATGVAHEIGNPIGIILGYLELLKREDPNKEEREDFVDRIESEITRISQTIRQLLDFSRPASGERVETNVHELIMETVDMLKPQPLTAHIEIQPLLKAASKSVWADPNQLKQVFLNIIMNAADAIPDDEASNDCTTTKSLTIHTSNGEGSIEIRFTDTGPGISQDELTHIFDPFYTTKEPGKGTGLGLSICYRIIEGLGGAIRAESKVGEGTTIIIDMPLYRNSSADAASKKDE